MERGEGSDWDGSGHLAKESRLYVQGSGDSLESKRLPRCEQF